MPRVPRGQLLPRPVYCVNCVRTRLILQRQRPLILLRVRTGHIPGVGQRDVMQGVRRGRLVRLGRGHSVAVQGGHVPQGAGRRLSLRMRAVPRRVGM